MFVSDQRRRTEMEENMWLLAIVIIALAGYLVYALINPEKF